MAMNPAEAHSDNPADIQQFFSNIVGGRSDRPSSLPPQGQRRDPSPPARMERPSAGAPVAHGRAASQPPTAGPAVQAPYFLETSSEVPGMPVQGPMATDPGPMSSAFGPPLGAPASPSQCGQYTQPLPMQSFPGPMPSGPYAEVASQRAIQVGSPDVFHINSQGAIPVGRPEEFYFSQNTIPAGNPDEFYPMHYGKQQDKAALDVMGMFATLFSALLVCTFITPLYLAYHVGSDDQVQFWIGSYINWVFILPPVYVVTHFYHVITKRPAKLLVVLSLIGSCVVILVLADRVLLDAYDRANEFEAKDCDTFPNKRELQREWDAAHAFYANCMQQVSKGLDIEFEAAIATYRMKDCKDYQDMLGKHPSWEYLGNLEENYACSGWCSRGQPLWTLGQVKDSCSATVADILRHKVQWCMLQVVIYTILALGMVSTSLIFIGPSLWGHRKRQGLDAA